MVRFKNNIGPFIKWVGGKQSIADQLLPCFPQDFKCLYEPFVGGGSIFMASKWENAVISDMNSWLIDTYKAIRDDGEQVADLLDNMPNEKNFFLERRSKHPDDYPTHFERAATFIYLNKTCFRGLFRVNKKGFFNVPYGEYNRRYYDPGNLKRVGDTLSKVEIIQGDFELCLAGVSQDDFVYFDPPYYKLGGHSDFNRYTPDQFKEAEHLRLAALCHELDQRNIRWAVSNSDTPFTRELFKNYYATSIRGRREINLNSKSRNVRELLFTNYEVLTETDNSLEQQELLLAR
ncbi:MAG: Dam family site-specific DNA-(adenine-N6)-methyltransferase [Verrucomicrobiales bacterium]|nr:Dam family site-specific DNA-(adenine-N6)-methyltransferase [Verrucomicrobiales bacterium]